MLVYANYFIFRSNLSSTLHTTIFYHPFSIRTTQTSFGTPTGSVLFSSKQNCVYVYFEKIQILTDVVWRTQTRFKKIKVLAEFQRRKTSRLLSK